MYISPIYLTVITGPPYNNNNNNNNNMQSLTTGSLSIDSRPVNPIGRGGDDGSSGGGESPPLNL